MAVFEDIDVGGGEFARADLLLEEQVEFGEGAAAGFGQAEVRVDDAEEAGSTPEEAGVVAPVFAGVSIKWELEKDGGKKQG